MVKIELVYPGSLRTEASHGPSGVKLITDAPVDNHGRGEHFYPTDLVATALASCTLTVMAIVANRHDWKLEGTRVSVEKHMITEPTRRIGRLVLYLTMPTGLPQKAHDPLERAAQQCPVHHSLHPDIEVELHFHW